MSEAMRAARALVFPSLWVETQGMTALEAMAMGTPVIVADGNNRFYEASPTRNWLLGVSASLSF